MRPWAGSGESELAYKQARIRACYDLHLAYRCARLLKWALLLAALGCGGLTLLGFALAIVSVAVAWCMISIPIRVLYPLEMALDVVQALLACSLFHASYSIAGGTGAFRCWTCLLAGNGVLALVALTKTSPLTFKWQLPALVAIGGTLLALAPGWAESNPLLQHGFSLLITLARILLPILAPAFVDLSPPEGFSALLASAPDPSQLSEAEAAARAAACAAAQAATVLLGCCSLALSQHRAEQRQRKQFVLAAYAAQRQQQQQQQQ